MEFKEDNFDAASFENSNQLQQRTSLGDRGRYINYMMLSLQYSGYNREFRMQVVQSALKASDCLIELDANGEQPLYRPREWKNLRRVQERKERRGHGMKEVVLTQ